MKKFISFLFGSMFLMFSIAYANPVAIYPGKKSWSDLGIFTLFEKQFGFIGSAVVATVLLIVFSIIIKMIFFKMFEVKKYPKRQPIVAILVVLVLLPIVFYVSINVLDIPDNYEKYKIGKNESRQHNALYEEYNGKIIDYATAMKIIDEANNYNIGKTIGYHPIITINGDVYTKSHLFESGEKVYSSTYKNEYYLENDNEVKYRINIKDYYENEFVKEINITKE